MDFIDDFIEEYKVNPCLWKADSVDFRNRSKRQEAYMKLIEVATKHGEMYNVERTKQKINNLRCAFRHQLRKCNEIKKKGEKFEPYCPKRRYFESLMFLKDEEIPDKKAKRHDNHPPLQQQYSESAVTLIPAENCEELSDAESLTKPHKADNQKLSPKNCPTEYLFEDASAACAPDPIISIQTVNANNNNNNHHGSGATIKEVEIVMTAADSRVISERRKSLPDIPKQIGNDSEQVRPVVAASQQKHNQNQNKINRKRSSSLSSQQSEDNEAVPAAKFRADISTIDFERLFSLALKSADHQLDDHFSSFGKIIAHKLRSMDATQAIYAEKIIADVLYQGQLKMLSTLSTHQFSGVDNATVYVDSHSK